MQQGKNEKDNVIKYPGIQEINIGKIDIIKNDKVIETLPNVEKNVDKKLQKAVNKSKNANFKANINDIKDLNEKSAEQNL